MLTCTVCGAAPPTDDGVWCEACAIDAWLHIAPSAEGYVTVGAPAPERPRLVVDNTRPERKETEDGR